MFVEVRGVSVNFLDFTMPITHVRKRPMPTYSPQDLINAVNDVLNKNKTCREAEELYGVPIAVIFHRINGRKVPIEKLGAGRPPVLDTDTENQIVLCLIARARMGYPCDKEELKDLVSEYVKANNVKNPFKDSRPGEDWYQCFMKRHPILSLKKAEHLQTCRSTARDPDRDYHFYEKLGNLYKKCGLQTEEMAMLRGIGEKGKPLSRVSGGSGWESISVLVCASTEGHFLPSLIIFNGAAVQARWTSEHAYPVTRYAASSNGWMEEQFFFSWFKNEFIVHINKIRNNQNLPNESAVLIFDGHSSHVSIRIIKEAIDNNRELIRLPSHLTDRIQPLNKYVFGPMGNISSRLSKGEFSKLLGLVLKESITLQNSNTKQRKKLKMSSATETTSNNPVGVPGSSTPQEEYISPSTPQKGVICENDESPVVSDRIRLIVKKKKSEKNKSKGNLEIDKSTRKETILETNLTKDSSDEENIENLRTQMEIENTPEIEYKKPQKKSVIPGVYVLVDLVGGKRNTTHFTYVCVVNSVERNEYAVTGFKIIDSKKNYFYLQRKR
ncbi:hypothetical protein NQ314_011349 [Rhamnusium bicolor]|uniref:DDE-1 domain-containing protein n=1 Tax=Rhamnusium bicolor TaxID=1586634 RepID=A0AAV8XJA8_9CUCU|nr:hypothetical protein NQ314_011349 [Rhamnusium bicolor]